MQNRGNIQWGKESQMICKCPDQNQVQNIYNKVSKSVWKISGNFRCEHFIWSAHVKNFREKLKNKQIVEGHNISTSKFSKCLYKKSKKGYRHRDCLCETHLTNRMISHKL